MKINFRNILFSLLWIPLVGIGVFRFWSLVSRAGGHWGITNNMSALSLVGYTVFYALIFFFTLTRLSRIQAVDGAWPRAAAFIGSFLPVLIVLFPERSLPLALLVLSLAFIILGDIFAIYGVVSLGTSFSVIPESRAIVTDGAYRFVRHPMYLFEYITAIGAFMQYASPYSALLLVVYLWFQIKRINNEEALLEKTFPEYVAYKAKTPARLIPGIY